MKTLNNFRKTAASIGIGLAVLILTGSPADAQGAGKQGNSDQLVREVAIVNAEIESAATPTHVQNGSVSKGGNELNGNESEATNHSAINVDAFLSSIEFENATDKPLTLEDWMTDNELFRTKPDEKVVLEVSGRSYTDY